MPTKLHPSPAAAHEPIHWPGPPTRLADYCKALAAVERERRDWAARRRRLVPVEPRMRYCDDLAAARGIGWGLVLSVALWAAVVWGIGKVVRG